MKYTTWSTALLIFVYILSGCKADTQTSDSVNNVLGSWQTQQILANGYYSEYLSVELRFNEDLSCEQISRFSSSGGLYRTAECTYRIEQNNIEVRFEGQPMAKATLSEGELVLAHAYGVSTGSGSPQHYQRP